MESSSSTKTLSIYRNDWLIDRLIDKLIDWDVTKTSEGLQNVGLCSALRVFEKWGIFIVPHLLWHGTSVFQFSSEGPPHLVFLLRHARGWLGPIFIRILRGQLSKKGIIFFLIKNRTVFLDVKIKYNYVFNSELLGLKNVFTGNCWKK
jgi:hypothetical protein